MGWFSQIEQPVVRDWSIRIWRFFADVVGAGRMPWSRFVLLDTVAACLWSACWISTGYVLGDAVKQLLPAFTPIWRWLLAGVAAGTVLVAAVVYLRRRRAHNAPDSTKI
jgi:membrane protein DedA with SNARE-associated domain